MSFYPLFQTPPPHAGKLLEFYQLWQSKCDGANIPSRQDMTFETLKGWHSNVRLVDLGEEILSPKRYHIMGEVYKKYWGNDTMLNQMMAAKPEASDIIDKYSECLECFYDYNYGIAIGTAPNTTGSVQKVIWMDLPLTNDPSRITHLISALIPLKDNKITK